MDLPIAIAVGLMYTHGVVATLMRQDAYLDSLTMLVALLLAGRVVDARGRSRAAEAASALAARAPATGRRRTGAAGAWRVETVAATELQPGDTLLLGAGEQVAADGIIRAGVARVERALLTGESEPDELSVGNEVIAGAVVL